MPLAVKVGMLLLPRRYQLLASGGFVLAVLLVVMSLGGLLLPSTYAREAPAWVEQALAQDWFDLVVGVPMLVLASLWAGRGSHRGLVVLAGTLLFAVYTAAVYAFAVHLNALFLVYCAALGVGLYSLIGALTRLLQAHITIAPIGNRRAGGVLVAIGSMFALLWFAQLVPAAMTGVVPAEIEATGLVTNPIHVLDLSFILPLHIIAGVALWRRHPSLALLGPVMFVFGSLMAASIGFLALYAGSTPVTIAMAVLATVSALFAFRTVRAIR